MNKSDIFKLIVEQTKQVLPDLEDYGFEPDDSLRELGANSIDRSEIIMMTLEALSLNIPMIKFAGAENIGELAERFQEHAAAL